MTHQVSYETLIGVLEHNNYELFQLIPKTLALMYELDSHKRGAAYPKRLKDLYCVSIT